MSDAELHELKRTFLATGAVEDEVAWLRQRMRTGELSRTRLRMAALCEHAASQLILAELPADPSEVEPRTFPEIPWPTSRQAEEFAERLECAGLSALVVAAVRVVEARGVELEDPADLDVFTRGLAKVKACMRDGTHETARSASRLVPAKPEGAELGEWGIPIDERPPAIQALAALITALNSLYPDPNQHLSPDLDPELVARAGCRMGAESALFGTDLKADDLPQILELARSGVIEWALAESPD